MSVSPGNFTVAGFAYPWVSSPAVSDVTLGVQYGALGVEFTGTLDAGTIPAVGDVREGVATGFGVGTLVLPSITDVRLGVGYGEDGTEFTGTYSTSPLPSGSNFLARGQDFLNRTEASAAGVAVTYTRGLHSVGLTALVGRTVFAQLQAAQSGAQVIFGEVDFLIQSADLVIDGVLTAPQKGDQVTWHGLTFELITPGGEPIWRHSDQTRTVYRVHAKRRV